MKTIFTMALPILPDKTDQWHDFADALRGDHFSDFRLSRERLGVRERIFLQKTQLGDMVIWALEGENAESAFIRLGQGTDRFSQWFIAQVKEIHGVDLSTKPKLPFPELIIDSMETVHAWHDPVEF